MNIVA